MTLTIWQRAASDPRFREKIMWDFQAAGLPADAARRLIEGKLAEEGAKVVPGGMSGMEGVVEDLNRQLSDLKERLQSVEAHLDRLLEGTQTEVVSKALGLPPEIAQVAEKAYREALAKRRNQEATARFMAEVKSITQGRRPKPKPRTPTEEKVRKFMEEASKPVRRRRD